MSNSAVTSTDADDDSRPGTSRPDIAGSAAHGRGSHDQGSQGRGVRSQGSQGQALPAVADTIAVAVFAVLARAAHNTPEMPFGLSGVVETLWPFLLGAVIGWVIVGLAGADLRRVSPAGLIVWLLTATTGLTIWGLRHGAVPHWSFIIVATVMSGLLLLGWRGVRALLDRRARSRTH